MAQEALPILVLLFKGGVAQSLPCLQPRAWSPERAQHVQTLLMANL
jgi:hypothetical protein